MYLVFTTISNTSPLLAIEMLNRISKLFKDYLGIFSEETVRLNFTLIYELLDELVDWGFPQATTTDSLKAYVFNEPVTIKKDDILKIDFSAFSNKTTSSASADKSIAARDREKQKNEIFVDIYERVNISFNSTGQILNQSIDGTIQMKSFLAGNPELSVSLNPDLAIVDIGPNGTAGRPGAVNLDDCNFHESVRLGEFDGERVLSLLPPEGEFTLMNYRLSAGVRAPFRIFPFFELVSPHKAELVVKVRADIPAGAHGSNVVIQIPMPRTSTSVACDAAEGQTHDYDSKGKTLTWSIRKFPGAKELVLRARIAFSSPVVASVRREVGPINMCFEIPMYSSSNLQIKHLKMKENRGYTPNRWVRYVTKADSYVCRM